MKIFISHSSKDYELAKTLKEILEESESIKEAFVYEDKKKLGTEISKKIIDEINSSDYLVALITKNSMGSASVNQEYGYAQAQNLEKIPFLEEGSEEGIMIYGTEKIVFLKNDFDEKCLEVKKYLLENGIPNRTQEKEKHLIQKSAYYRQHLEYVIEEFLEEVYYRLNIGCDNEPFRLDSEEISIKRELFGKIKNFFSDEYPDVISHISQINFVMYRKLDMEMIHCKREIERTERFPHTELPQSEADQIVKLKESLIHMNEGDLNVQKFCEDLYHPDTQFHFTSCSQIMNDNEHEQQIRRFLKITFNDLKTIVSHMIKLLELFLEYKKQFGTIAFKNTFED